MPPVITLFESYGACADQVGPRLAAALGVEFLGQVLSSEDVEGAGEPREGWLGRLVAGVVGPGAALAALEAAGPQEDRVRANVAEVQAAAARGAVILGRNATVLLADRPGVLNVKLDGPHERRIAYAARAAGISEAHAAKRLAREDRLRAELSLALYGWDPRLNDRYHLVLNPFLLGIDTAVDLALAALRRQG